MPSNTHEQSNIGTEENELMQQFFGEFETRTNFVGFFDLLYKVDRRLEPERYEDGAELP